MTKGNYTAVASRHASTIIFFDAVRAGDRAARIVRAPTGRVTPVSSESSVTGRLPTSTHHVKIDGTIPTGAEISVSKADLIRFYVH